MSGRERVGVLFVMLLLGAPRSWARLGKVERGGGGVEEGR